MIRIKIQEFHAQAGAILPGNPGQSLKRSFIGQGKPQNQEGPRWVSIRCFNKSAFETKVADDTTSSIIRTLKSDFQVNWEAGRLSHTWFP
jgi:hypothetical protein